MSNSNTESLRRHIPGNSPYPVWVDGEYRSYLGLPMVAGICTMEEAQRTSYDVETNFELLRRYYYVLSRTHQILLAWMNPTPIYELKMGYSYHAYLCTENMVALATRVGEMREPPTKIEKVPEPALKTFFDAVLRSATCEEMLCGIYAVVLPELESAVQRHLDETNRLVDQPTCRIARSLLRDVREMTAWGATSLKCLDHARNLDLPGWTTAFRASLVAAGGVRGDAHRVVPEQPHPNLSRTFKIDTTPRRDERFFDAFNYGVNTYNMVWKPKEYDAISRNFCLLLNRMREIDVPEWMSAIMLETPDKPLAYYRDITRQMWDEARHGIMGEVGLVKLGIDWTQARIRCAWSWELNQTLNALERHSVLYRIERGLMPKEGKRFEWETAVASGDPLSALFHDYDWADEVLHAAIGRKWFVSHFENNDECNAFIDEVFERFQRSRIDVQALGLTEHYNWWGDYYRHCCAVTGIPVNERIASFQMTELEAPPAGAA